MSTLHADIAPEIERHDAPGEPVAPPARMEIGAALRAMDYIDEFYASVRAVRYALSTLTEVPHGPPQLRDALNGGMPEWMATSFVERVKSIPSLDLRREAEAWQFLRDYARSDMKDYF